MFQPIEENVSVYKKVVAQIQEMIMHGELKKGDRLPPERQLAEMLGVGRPALKQAISALEVLGIIRSRQGDGNYITADTVEVINPLAMQFYLKTARWMIFWNSAISWRCRWRRLRPPRSRKRRSGSFRR